MIFYFLTLVNFLIYSDLENAEGITKCVIPTTIKIRGKMYISERQISNCKMN